MKTSPVWGFFIDYYTRENPFTVKSEAPVDKDSVPEADVAFTTQEHGLTATYTLPEGYTPVGRLLNSRGGVVAQIDGRFEITVSGNVETVEFSGGFAQNTPFTYEARVKKDSTITTIKTIQITLKGE